jgi:hypothetical protein
MVIGLPEAPAGLGVAVPIQSIAIVESALRTTPNRSNVGLAFHLWVFTCGSPPLARGGWSLQWGLKSRAPHGAWRPTISIEYVTELPVP